MANNPKLSNAEASAAADAVGTNANSGFLRIYNGTQPATADTAITTQTLLAELTLNADAFAAASNGVATANAITADSSANATGTATWFRVVRSNGTSVMFDGSVGTSNADLILNTTSIVAGANVSISSFTYTQSKG
jgi:sulfur carrier protein ThiS